MNLHSLCAAAALLAAPAFAFQVKVDPELPKYKKPKEGVFSPVGKEHPVIAKLKATLGMNEVSSKLTNIGGTRYEMRRLRREELIKATSLAAHRTDNPASMRGNIECAILAHAVLSIDGVDLVDLFCLEPEVQALPVVEKKVAAREAYFDLLLDSPNELIETLMQFYDNTFPQIDLLDKDKVLGYCPVAKCQHKRVIPLERKGFCPDHGRELVTEIPNPF